MSRRHTVQDRHQTVGFTLIELMIVVVVIAILAAIAYPTYMDQVRKARRADAKNALLETAQRLERCYTDFNAYNDANCPVSFPVTSPEGYYTITVARTASTYTLTAQPATGSPQNDDTGCTSFTLDQAGNKGATGSQAATCWD